MLPEWWRKGAVRDVAPAEPTRRRRPSDPGRRRRLRYELHPAARRRRRPGDRRAGRPGPPDDDRPARARAWTGPGGSPPRRWSGPSPPAGSTRRVIKEHGRRAGALRGHLRLPGRREPRRVRPRASWTSSGVEPEVITGDQEAEFSFTGATKELDRARPTWPGPSWWWTSAAARPSSWSATTRCAPRAPSTSAACG